MKNITRRSMLKLAGGSAVGLVSSSAFGSLVSSAMEGNANQNDTLIRLNATLVRKQLQRMGFSNRDSELIAGDLVMGQVQVALNSAVSAGSGKRTRVVVDMGSLQRGLSRAMLRDSLLDMADISQAGQELAEEKCRALSDGLPRGIIASQPVGREQRSLSGGQLREALSTAVNVRRLKILGFTSREAGDLVARMSRREMADALENVDLQMGAGPAMKLSELALMLLLLGAVALLFWLLIEEGIMDEDDEDEADYWSKEKREAWRAGEMNRLRIAMGAVAALALALYVSSWYD